MWIVVKGRKLEMLRFDVLHSFAVVELMHGCMRHRRQVNSRFASACITDV